MNDCAVILVNYRQPALTEAAVASLRACSEWERLSVYVVDNGSDDGSYGRLQASCPDCTVLSADGNLGFSGGNNVGIRKALSNGARWILLLNNDAEATPGFLTPLLAAAADGRTLATPKITYADAPGRVWYGGGFVDRKRGGFYHETEAARAEVARDVSFASGCCLLLPAAFFTDGGLLDESFFLYYEDAELCLRATRAGYRIRYVPQAVVRHRVSASTGGDESRLAVYYGTRNRLAVLSRFGFPFRAKAFVVLSRLVKIVAAPFRSARWHAVRGVMAWMSGRTGARIAIDGAFAGRPVTGLERFAVECVRALDDLVAPGVLELVVPPQGDVSALGRLRNIAVVRCGFGSGRVWEQVCFGLYARLHGRRTLSLCNVAPLLRTDVVCIHDVFYRSRSGDYAGSLRGRLSSAWHRLHYAWCARFASRIVTVSEYSASEITRWYGVTPERIAVAGNGWEHLTRIAQDDGVFTRFPELRKDGYCLALGSRAPNKNLGWVMRTARRNPDLRFVVAGGAFPSGRTCETGWPSNVLTTGRVSDGEMKALVSRCRVLLFPSVEEGFGIPPLEALALGRPVVVADRPPMREIYGDTVRYLKDSEGDGADALAEWLATPVGPPEALLSRHTWSRVSRVVLSAVVHVR